mgnify:CR=1 FL=1
MELMTVTLDEGNVKYIEEHTDLCADDLETAKTAIGRAHTTLLCSTPKLTARTVDYATASTDSRG